jgi:acyl transferase domain-containing protein
MSGADAQHPDAIAVVGMAGRFPGAGGVDAFWDNLVAGVECVSFLSDDDLLAAGVPAAQLRDPGYVRARAVIDGVERFDARLFGYSAREAEIMDPQQRVFLECAWEALEDAGHDPARFPGRIGTFAGCGISTYLLNLYASPAVIEAAGPYQVLLANDKDHLTQRVAYKLDLRGPALTIQTNCSTSLVAVHLACQSLLTHQCDMALAGGVTISLPQGAGYLYQEDGILSPDGHCRAFDAGARGTVPGNGAGLVVLRRLDDALDGGDLVRAIVRGSAVNNDGAAKVGYTAPGVSGQAEVIAEALAVAEVDPASISYIEAHGTGTSLGDPIEVAALARVFGGALRPGECALGSVKTNVGHLDTASGVAGLIKTVLALEHRSLPPSLNFRSPNPKMRLAETPFHVNTTLRPWENGHGPRRAGVSSFGIGGTNAHVVLEEAARPPAPAPSRPVQVLVLSAASEAAVETAARNLAGRLAERPPACLADVAHTLQVGRRLLPHRRALACRTAEDAATALAALDPDRVRRSVEERDDRPVAFLLPGQGSQRVGMGAGLYRSEPVFQEVLDHCAEVLRSEIGLDVREVLYPAPAGEAEAARRLEQTALAQPALFAVEYALARTWMAWGVRPAAMIGHSVGEFVAAALADVMPADDALRAVAARGRLMQEMPGGAMLAVAMPEDRAREVAAGVLAVAAVNAPALCVLAGPHEAVAACRARLRSLGVSARLLHTSHAFHSPMMDPVLPRFEAVMRALSLRAPRLPYVSNVTGTWITEAEATNPGYWAGHVRAPVRFADGMRALLADAGRVLLEVGPGETLASLARQQGEPAAVSSLPSRTADGLAGDGLADALGRLWLAGAGVDWHAHHAGHGRRRVRLPTYPFQRERYWVGGPGRPDPRFDGGSRAAAPELLASDLHDRPNLPTPYAAPGTEVEAAVAEVWRLALGLDRVGVHDSFVELGGHSLMATQVVTRLRQVFAVDLGLERFFEADTVALLSAAIEELLLAEVEALSDEEVRRLTAAGQAREEGLL